MLLTEQTLPMRTEGFYIFYYIISESISHYITLLVEYIGKSIFNFLFDHCIFLDCLIRAYCNVFDIYIHKVIIFCILIQDFGYGIQPIPS